MTTPRDDIAGLLNDIEDRRSHPAYPHHLDELFDEAATQLDSLLKERDALQARVKELEENITEIPQLLRKANARATRLQQERDEAYERAAVKVRDVLCCMDWPPSNGDELIDTLQAAIRRLAAGPEKIAAANDGEERM